MADREPSAAREMLGRFVTSNSEETEALGASLPDRIGAFRLLLLEGDLGSGKTTFVRGLARGLAIDSGEVASPTFALLNEYGDDGSGRPRLRHLDLYRVDGLDSIRDVGLLEILDEDIPVVVEWPRGGIEDLPGAIIVRIDSTGETERLIEMARIRAAGDSGR